MNVLLYAGPGTEQNLEHTRYALRSLLGHAYDVLPITADQLADAPWTDRAVALVVPGGRDLPYVENLKGVPNLRIKKWVEGGGKYLGICAGAYYACTSIEFEMGTQNQVQGTRELAFFPGKCTGAAFPGFQYHSDTFARNVKVDLNTGEFKKVWTDAPTQVQNWWNGGGTFVDADKYEGVTVLGTFNEVPDRPAAGVKCKVGKGTAVLWSPHVERNLIEDQLTAQGSDIVRAQSLQIELFRASLLLLDLNVSLNPAPVPFTTAQYLFTTDMNLLNSTRQALGTVCGDSLPILNDSTDKFLISGDGGKPSSSSEEDETFRKLVLPPSIWSASDAILVPFNLAEYFQALGKESNLGKMILCADVVTSTQSLLDKNPKLLMALPEGLVSVASQQVSGRGRGNNTWVSPLGCLMFSLLVHFPGRLANKLVFGQYLFGLAVTEGIKKLSSGRLIPRLKWPNDIYIDLGQDKSASDRYKKLGGILVNSSWSGGDFTLVIGCGVNITNSQPTTCLRDLAQQLNLDPSLFTRERVLAAILTTFTGIWTSFIRGGGNFAAFSEAYLDAWLHTGQNVTIQASGQQVKIVGIETDFGLLRTVAEDGSCIDLQPDGNSFDMLQGLLKRK